MSQYAFILGGTGQIGRAMARAFVAANWRVTISHRGTHPPPKDLIEQGARLVTLDRDQPGELSRALSSGADVLIDTTAYDGDHANQLIALQESVGSFVVISSASVYRDSDGRTLDEAAQNGFPQVPVPIPETHMTVDPGPATYSTRKVVLERHLLDHASPPVTILRPCAIHGTNSRHPREWWVVKRILDRRPAILLAYNGMSRFHTSAVANIAELSRVVAENPKTQILNIADPDPPTVADIVKFATQHFEYEGRIVPVDEPSFPPTMGRTPWSVPRPFVLDCRAALTAGYVPATTYAKAISATCDWLVRDNIANDWQDRYPVLASYPNNLFDYVAEDAFLKRDLTGTLDYHSQTRLP